MSDHQQQEQMVLESRLEEIRRAELAVVTEAHNRGFSENDCFAIRLAMEEALTNAIKHGNCFDPEKRVELTYLFDDESVTITICDQGEGFMPGEVPDCRLDENISKVSGRGIMLMKAYMSEVKYSDNSTCVTLIKKRNDT